MWIIALMIATDSQINIELYHAAINAERGRG